MFLLEQFLRTGHLGPITLGMLPNDVMIALGEPDGISPKSNPLLLKYGAIELTFWKSPRDQGHELREIVLTYQTAEESAPNRLIFDDWHPEGSPTERAFRDFMHGIGFMPVHMVEGPSGRNLIFPSGVTVLFSDGMLNSMRLTQRRTKEATQAPLSDSREPGTSQITEMLEEAERAMHAGASRAALLIAWAGLEAVLRRRALQAGRLGKIGVQPSILLRELFAAGVLDSEQHSALEKLRQLRMAAAHGLSSATIPDNVIPQVIGMANALLGSVAE